MNSKIPAAILIFLFAVSNLSAHHLWIESSEKELFVSRGFFPDSLETYNTDAVKGAAAWNSEGGKIDIKPRDPDNRVIFKAENRPAVAVAWSEWGYRVNTTQGKKMMSPRDAEKQGLTVIDSFTSSHFAKSIFGESPAMMKYTGMMFEIVPLDNPFQIKRSNTIRVKVIFDGKPLAGTIVTVENGGTAETDRNGTARIKLPDRDKQLIWVCHRVEEPDNSEKDYSMYMTFMTISP